MYTLLITLHTVTASVALLAGFFTRRGRGWFATYYWSLVGMLVFLVLAVAADWHGRDLATHVVVGALIALGALMVAKAEQARRTRTTSRRRYVDHVGFTIVGLVDAFVVVTVITVGVPGWLTSAIGAGIAVAGHVVIARVRRMHRTVHCNRPTRRSLRTEQSAAAAGS